HASEVAPAQHAPELAWRMVTGEDAETRAIRQNVILLQIPVINPDGLDWIAHWYTGNVGTAYEQAPLPWLYQKYAGHDNNRDWFMLNLQETRNVTRLLFQEWFPQILYNQHQSPPFPARIFIPPYAEPLNPNIPAAVMEGINVIGMTMKERFARENKPGILSYWGYDGWWNGGLRSVPAFHNMHGILTEVAGTSFASPRTYRESSLPHSFPNGYPTHEPTIFYEMPWRGGRWSVRNAIDYMLTADYAILTHAAMRRSDFLLKAWQMARAEIDEGNRGNPYAYVVSPKQWDQPTALEFLERLAASGVAVERARAAFQAGGKSYPEGTFVLRAGQPFRPYLMDLVEPQKYPELRTGTGGPTKRPYDIAGWTLSMQMGVVLDRIVDRFEADLEPLARIPEAPAHALDHRENASFLETATRLEKGERMGWTADGAIVTGGDKSAYELHIPRVALYVPWLANADTGWTEWLLDHYKIKYTELRNKDFDGSDLRTRFDSIILAQQTAASIMHGGTSDTRAGRENGRQRPQYTGGIGLKGVEQIEQFVRAGGTLIALDQATEVPVQFFQISIRNALRPAGSASPEGDAQAAGARPDFYCPGSLLRLSVDNTQPLAFGMPKEVIAFSTGGEAFDAPDKEAHAVARFAESNVLASGWLSGKKEIAGKAALVEVKYGRGQAVLFGFRPQFRGQPYGTFKFLLNAIYLASSKAAN
ncbi:MAG TPA: M14 family metallopeptidase, partial [Terriglobales bacterium]|nr:M14 family metallopeptidase [Terriglobales bacterium]